MKKRILKTAFRMSCDVLFGLLICCIFAPLVMAGSSSAHCIEEAIATIKGRVIDANTGEPLPGANIRLVGTSIGTATDREGKYILNRVPAGNYTLEVTFIGYESKEVEIIVADERTVQRDISLSSTVVEGKDVIVTGQRKGQIRAFNQQKTALNIKNVVSQEQIQRFADSQVAEGLKRIPGITVSQDYGEAIGVRIRALSSDLNSTTVDGNRLASNSAGGRGLNLSAMLANMVESIEVNKTLTPDMDADAIGGSINFVTKDPSYASGPILSISAGGNYNEQALTNTGYDVSATYGNQAGGFGYLFSISANSYHRAEESIHYDWAEPGNEYERIQLYNYTIDRERLGGSTHLSYTFNAQSKIYLKGMYNKYDDAQHVPKFILTDLDGEQTTMSGNNQQVQDASIERQGGNRKYERDLSSISAGGEHILSNGWNLDYNGAWSYGEDIQPENYATQFSQTMHLDINKSSIDYPAFSFTGGDPYDPALYHLLRLSSNTDTTYTNNLSAAFNIEAPFETGSLTGSIKWGSKVKTEHSDSDKHIFRVSPLDNSQITMDSYLWNDFSNSKHYEGRYDFGPVPDAGKVYHEAYLQNPSQFTYAFDSGSSLDEFEATENIVAGYIMATINYHDLKIIGGGRYEYTAMDYSGNQLIYGEDDSEETSTVSDTDNYGGFYPMLQLRYQLTSNLNLRAGVSRTLARPNYEDLVPYEEINVEDQEVERGNPALEPYHATNLDFMIEQYLTPGGLLSAGVFYKEVGNYIVDMLSVEDEGLYAGYDVEKPENASDARIFGIELHGQQQLSFLPGVLKGLGLYANYTYTNTNLKVPGQDRETPIPGQIPHSANVAIMYDQFGFSGTISLHYQDRIIDDFGATAADDEYFGKRTQIDIQASQQITPNFTLFVDLKNITNEPYKYYATDTEGNRIPFENALYSWESSFGLRFEL